ncbi:hypothetical protein BDU57DRAFT_301596 [Ampelomyces quisqualis]|uniref:Uncharacterized protein n=1 Tax=Ampelomyces quisqualis TaxID=50730 RepID=A0A6A5QGQ6_AMPQU|nr:hypothetical protein BDU57DRAFT_301596 [Ampelomyces quisqualis]
MYVQQRDTMALAKRDNMGYAMPPPLIVFLCILGAGFAVCIGFAIFRFYGDSGNSDIWQKRRPDQDAYMREVRERNWYRLSGITGQNIYAAPNQDMAHAPMSPSGNSTTTYG